MTFNLLFLGDIIGKTGRGLLREHLGSLIREYDVDFVVANGENAAAGFGITKKVYEELLSFGIDVITGGNHIWDKKDFVKDAVLCDKILRPLNVSSLQPGRGALTVEKDGVKITVINMLGRVFMPHCDCPFVSFDRLFHEDSSDFIVVDFHAEATSEKNAFGLYVDGRASAVLGTHTHVQTNDERFLPKGTFYITDVGMCGSIDSVIGMNAEKAIYKLISGMPERNEVEEKGRKVISGVVLKLDIEKKAAVAYNKIYKIYGE